MKEDKKILNLFNKEIKKIYKDWDTFDAIAKINIIKQLFKTIHITDRMVSLLTVIKIIKPDQSIAQEVLILEEKLKEELETILKERNEQEDSEEIFIKKLIELFSKTRKFSDVRVEISYILWEKIDSQKFRWHLIRGNIHNEVFFKKILIKTINIYHKTEQRFLEVILREEKIDAQKLMLEVFVEKYSEEIFIKNCFQLFIKNRRSQEKIKSLIIFYFNINKKYISEEDIYLIEVCISYLYEKDKKDINNFINFIFDKKTNSLFNEIFHKVTHQKRIKYAKDFLYLEKEKFSWEKLIEAVHEGENMHHKKYSDKDKEILNDFYEKILEHIFKKNRRINRILDFIEENLHLEFLFKKIKDRLDKRKNKDILLIEKIHNIEQKKNDLPR